MDETREMTRQRLASKAERPRGDEGRSARFEPLAQSMSAAGYDPAALAATFLEGCMEILEFERGFLFVTARSHPAGQDADAPSLRPVASRVRKGTGGGSEWAPVRNPEFAVTRSVIQRALASPGPIVINDCLLQPTPQSEVQHRAVLCHAFEIAPGLTGIVYLDSGLGRDELGDAEIAAMRDLTERCLVIFSRGFVACRLAEAERRLRAEGDADPADVAGDEPEDDPAVDLEEAPSFHGIVGRDEKLEKIFTVVRKIKDSDLSVCIFGESGTGKELLARAIHDSSGRRDKPFIGENCGAIPENLLESELFGHMKGSFTGADEDKKGLFEAASGGTLFLDEIGDMSEGMQRKLLRVLQEGVIRPIGGKTPVKVDVRVICASNRDLKLLVGKGTFRADLYYRLNVITIQLPPLRDRPGDIPLLVAHLAAKIAEEENVKRRFSQSAMKALCEYPWPGNIRELRNVLRRAMITGRRRLIARKEVMPYLSQITAAPRSGENIDRDGEQLVLRVPVRESFNEIIEECERVVLENALKQCAWNKSKVTKALKIPRQSLYNKIAKYKLERNWGGAEEAEE